MHRSRKNSGSASLVFAVGWPGRRRCRPQGRAVFERARGARAAASGEPALGDGAGDHQAGCCAVRRGERARRMKFRLVQELVAEGVGRRGDLPGFLGSHDRATTSGPSAHPPNGTSRRLAWPTRSSTSTTTPNPRSSSTPARAVDVSDSAAAAEPQQPPRSRSSTSPSTR